ncbi:MAG: hypothetical protein RI514_08670, partial [Spiribacter sp.]|nr:hypothetical protein [Spiribacter sp.]
MSYSDRRLRQAAEEADRQQSDQTDESAFDEGLRQAAERQSESRDVRPGRGTEDRVVEREPSGGGGGGGASRPSPEPETDESAFDEGLRQAAERQSESRDERPDRGVSDDAGDSGVVDRAVEAAGGLADRATEA